MLKKKLLPSAKQPKKMHKKKEKNTCDWASHVVYSLLLASDHIASFSIVLQSHYASHTLLFQQGSWRAGSESVPDQFFMFRQPKNRCQS